VASSIRITVLPLARGVSRDPFRPLRDPLAPTEVAGPLPVVAAVYGNPFWEAVQTAIPFVAIAGALRGVFKNSGRLIDMIVSIATVREQVWARRNELRAQAARSKVEEVKALAELAELGYDVRTAFSEGRKVRSDSKQIEQGVAAATLFTAVSEIPDVSMSAEPAMRVVTAEEVQEETTAVRDAAAAEDLPVGRDVIPLSAGGDQDAQE
jgi:hypothetical protein